MFAFRSFRLFNYKLSRGAIAAIAGGGLATGIYCLPSLKDKSFIYAEINNKNSKISYQEVLKHNTKRNRIWVTRGEIVYDITDFIDIHPGGERIMLAAGKSVDPYWYVQYIGNNVYVRSIFSVHNTEETRELLEEYRIGVLDMSTVPKEPVDPGLAKLFSNEPNRDQRLKTLSQRPCNAEAPLSALKDFITPTELHFVRHHLPVPEGDYKVLEISGPKNPAYSITLEELKGMPSTEVDVTLQCAGNRRKEMHQFKPTKGLLWSQGAISNAHYKGVLLKKVLEKAGYSANDIDEQKHHIEFQGQDGYKASVPANKVMSATGDVLLVYEMNGEELTKDHGYPIRALIPGHVAARSVKWVNRIAILEAESSGHWQRRDYKGFGPTKTLETSNYDNAESIQELPVTSSIVSPNVEEKPKFDSQGRLIVEGYAWSGGGRGINRVDVSADGGKTWIDAELLEGHNQPKNKHWAWTKWKAALEIPKNNGKVELVCKAVDSSYNSQPESFEGIYNVRGVLSNAWHKIQIQI